MKRKRGRPKLPASRRKSVLLTIHFSKETMRRIKTAARADGITASEFIHDCASNQAGTAEIL